MKNAHQLAERFAGFINRATAGRQITPHIPHTNETLTMGFYAKSGDADFEQACQDFEDRLAEKLLFRWVAFWQPWGAGCPAEHYPAVSGPVQVVATQRYDTLKGQWENQLSVFVAIGEECKPK